MAKFGIGQAVRRVEDQRFLTGAGRYIEDINLPGQAYGVPVLSPHAHARIKRIDVAKAKISFSPVLVGIHLFAIDHLVLPAAPKSILPGTQYGTGPPSVNSFVETVLRRSLRENAPPLLF